MAATPDHLRRDAEHAARLEISKVLERYKRRMYEGAQALISREISDAPAGIVLDGTAIGEEAGRAGVAAYLGAAEARPAIEAGEDSVTES